MPLTSCERSIRATSATGRSSASFARALQLYAVESGRDVGTQLIAEAFGEEPGRNLKRRHRGAMRRADEADLREVEAEGLREQRQQEGGGADIEEQHHRDAGSGLRQGVH